MKTGLELTLLVVTSILLFPSLSAPAVAQEESRKEITTAALPPSGEDARLEATIGALTLESDFTVFMRPSVSEEVRQKALRRLWKLLPVTADFENTLF